MIKPEFVTIGKLFENSKYSIPLYQREYAWTIEHISQLLSDIASNVILNSEVNYYLGTLVLFEQNEKFETIDGQQRLTTLFLLLCYLKSKENRNFTADALTFDSRNKSTKTLNAIFKGVQEELTDAENNVIKGYEIIEQQLYNICEEFSISIEQFSNYFESKVQLLRVFVPQNTDLNHYFEIMNVRGEQLEKHEILKSRMMDKLEKEQDRQLFSVVWDASSDMNKYIQLSLIKETKTRRKIFGQDWNYIPSNYEDLYEKFRDSITEKGKEQESVQKKDSYTLEKILAKNTIVNTEKPTIQDEWSNLTSVINFPNFLLQVLSVFCPEDNITLDDKRLLEEFEPYYLMKTERFENAEIFVKKFCFALFKSKFLFDKYIIRNREENNNTEWLLRQIKPYEISFNWVETFGTNSDGDSNVQESIIMLQSMFHVSFPTRIYKNWFTAVLNYLWKNEANGAINGDEFKSHLLRISDAFYFDRDGKEPIPYRKIIFENKCIAQNDIIEEESFGKGVDTKNFVFNRLDYKLWEKKDQISWPIESKKYINNFKFTFRSSVEHFYPQNPNTRINAQYDVDKFGNLCLIDRGKNSQLSNNEPIAKVSFYKNTSNIDSLKLQLMLKNAADWGKAEVMENHETEMKKLLNASSI